MPWRSSTPGTRRRARRRSREDTRARDLGRRLLGRPVGGRRARGSLRGTAPAARGADPAHGARPPRRGGSAHGGTGRHRFRCRARFVHGGAHRRVGRPGFRPGGRAAAGACLLAGRTGGARAGRRRAPGLRYPGRAHGRGLRRGLRKGRREKDAGEADGEGTGAGGLRTLAADRLTVPDGVQPEKGNWWLAGGGWDRYPEMAPAGAVDTGLRFPRAHEVAVLAAPRFAAGDTVTPRDAEPAYLRRTVAQQAP